MTGMPREDKEVQFTSYHQPVLMVNRIAIGLQLGFLSDRLLSEIFLSGNYFVKLEITDTDMFWRRCNVQSFVQQQR